VRLGGMWMRKGGKSTRERKKTFVYKVLRLDNESVGKKRKISFFETMLVHVECVAPRVTFFVHFLRVVLLYRMLAQS
jgi:hypothetical protein